MNQLDSYWKHLNITAPKVNLIEAGSQSFVPNQINNYIVKHDIVVHAIVSGKGFYKVNGEKYLLGQNDGFILRKNEHVFYKPDDENPWTTIWIGFNGDEYLDYIINTEIMTQSVIKFRHNSATLTYMQELVSFLSQNDENMPINKLHLYSIFFNFLLELNYEFYDYNTDHYINYMTNSDLANAIYNYIYHYFAEGLTVEGLAKAFNLSRNALFLLCKKRFGQSPKQLIQELRMNKASQLLRNTDLKIKEIAASTGYNDSMQFSRSFKSYYHYTPTEFRELDLSEIDKALFVRRTLEEK